MDINIGVIMLLKQCFLGLIFLFSTSVMNAQIHGLSVSDLADPAGKGMKHLMGFTSKGENSSSYCGRFAYGISERILLFTDIGTYKHELASAETMAQFGLRYSLPFEIPFDLAVRTTLIPYIASYEHYVELTMSLLASRNLDSKSKWSIYGGLGVDFQEWELEMALDPVQAAYLGQDTYTDKGDQTDPVFFIGTFYKLMDKIRIFIETAHVKEFYGNIGIRFDL